MTRPSKTSSRISSMSPSSAHRGSRSRASEVLNRKRPLTMEMAWRLHREWKIPAEALLKPYHVG